MVLQIVLTVLKVIGIILLCLLALLLIILISPIRYKADIGYHDNKPVIKGVITYFFRFLRIYADYPSDRILKIKVLFFTLNSDKEDKGSDEDKHEEKKSGKEDVKPDGAKEENKSLETKDDTAEPPLNTENEKEKASESTENTDFGEEKTGKAKDPLPERIRLTLEKICGKIECTVKAVEKTEDFLELNSTRRFLEVTKKAGIRMFRSMKPHISGKAVIGMEDPSTTGLICAVYGVLSPYRKGNFTLDARFEEEIIDADIKIRGRIILMVIILQTLRILIFGHALKVKKNLDLVLKAWRKNGNE
ncbi:MAG: hypothetical protein IJ589_05290 [Lachnospiraceae bacterium]|nr:hypothetical protein [Lachnospiraceae bacterium]